jgi:hypothetical protein
LKGRVIKGELVELEPQPNVLTAGFDDRLAHCLAILRRGSGSYQSCRPLSSIAAIQA